MLTLSQVAERLQQADHILLLSHRLPDGDTLGSANALLRALRRLGKKVRFLCEDKVQSKYAFLFADLTEEDFVPEYIVSVDVADTSLLGPHVEEEYGKRLNLCIDHHGSNALDPTITYVDAKAAATAEIIFQLYELLGLQPDSMAANALFAGLATDTGCFRYQNTTPRTHRIAAALLELGANGADLCRMLFETRTRARIQMESYVLSRMRYYLDGRCTAITVDKAGIAQCGAGESDLDGISALPRQIEGVLVGVTLRERENGEYKVSLRTNPPVNASEICAAFGGGGHPGAAGCTLSGAEQDVEEKIVAAIRAYFEENGI